MDIPLLVVFVASATVLFAALRYGIVGGAGGITRKQDYPISYWIGVAVAAMITLGSFAALIATTRL